MEDSKTILESMMETTKRFRKQAEHARKFIKNRTGRTPVHSNAKVKQLRSEWIKSAEFKNITLMHLAVLHKVPVYTARKLCYDVTYRTHPDSQPDAESLARAYARMLAIQGQYDDFIKKEQADNKSAKTAGQYSTNDYKRLEKSKTSQTSETDEQPAHLKAIEGKNIINYNDAFEAARLYLISTNNMNHSALSKLAKEIAGHLGITT